MLSVGDGVIKSMAGQWPSTAVAALRYVLGASGLAALLYWKEGRAGFVMPDPRKQLLRGAGVSLATISFMSAIYVMPLASATAIGFTSPILTGLLATLLLGEPARRENWIASILAFAGVLIVLRPNFMTVGWAVLLPLAAALGMSILMIGNRMVAGRASPLAMQYFIAACAAPMLVVAAIAFDLSGIHGLVIGWPSWSVLARCATVAVTATLAHWLIYLGTTRAGAASIAPMTYVQLLVATLVGWMWFDNHPDRLTLLGSGLIILAGLYLWRATTRRDSERKIGV